MGYTNHTNFEKSCHAQIQLLSKVQILLTVFRIFARRIHIFRKLKNLSGDEIFEIL